MKRVQLAIFPGILLSIVFILVGTNLISNPQVVLAANDQPIQTQNSAAAGSKLSKTAKTNNTIQPEVFQDNEAGLTGSSQTQPGAQGTPIPQVDAIFVDVKAPADGSGETNPGTQSNGCSLSPSYSNSILQWCNIIEKYAGQNGLEPGLVAALITQESGGDSSAYSSSGAVGLMQVMPRDGLAASFTCASGPCFVNRPSINELQNPEYNIAYGTRLLSALVQKYGSLREALKYYGPMDMGYNYADLVLNIFQSHP